jgi:hypothetical protein
MSCRNAVSFVAMMVIVMASAGLARGGVAVLDQSVKVDKAAGDATFTIDFGHTPDFTTTDAGGRPADSFQIDIAADPTGPNPLANLTTVIRGDEIRFANNIPIRDAFPADLNDPHAGGWGKIRGSVPFSVIGTQLSFTAPLALLGAPDGKFAYQADTFHYGPTQAEAKAESVPLPSALATAAMMLAIGLLIALFKSIIESGSMRR